MLWYKSLETKLDLAVEWIGLVKYRIDHNWACYSMADDHCRFPCNNMEDDMRGLYSKIVRAKSVSCGSTGSCRSSPRARSCGA